MYRNAVKQVQRAVNVTKGFTKFTVFHYRLCLLGTNVQVCMFADECNKLTTSI